eukprot:4334749-Pleurochrysis_carterae.AAC.1
MATHAATPEGVSTPTHRPPGRHTWFHLRGLPVARSEDGAGWLGRHGVRAPRVRAGEMMAATTPLPRGEPLEANMIDSCTLATHARQGKVRRWALPAGPQGTSPISLRGAHTL